jgi:hypothetical protein
MVSESMDAMHCLRGHVQAVALTRMPFSVFVMQPLWKEQEDSRDIRSGRQHTNDGGRIRSGTFLLRVLGYSLVTTDPLVPGQPK